MKETILLSTSGTRAVFLEASDAGCPFPTIYYSIDGKPTQTGTVKVHFDLTSSQSAKYWAKDSSNNVSATKTIPALGTTVTDTTAPTMTESVTPDADGRTVTLTAADNESTPTIYYVLNGGAAVNTGLATFTRAIATADTLEYWAVDKVGNASKHKVIASAAPSVSLVVLPKSMTYPSIVTLTAVARNIDATAAAFEVQYPNTNDDTWKPILTVSSSTGVFVLLHIPTKAANYRVTVGGVTSTPVSSVLVRARISKPQASTLKFKVGALARFWGTIRPQHPAVDPPAADTSYKVRFWKWNPVAKRWVETGTVPWKIEKVLSSDESQWSYSRKFTASQVGSWRVAFYHLCPRHAAKTSPVLQFTVVK